jgi:ATP-dependent HslUV protease ATP-binding subunit HslU
VIELETASQTEPMLEMFGGQGMEEMGINLKNMLSKVMPGRTSAGAGEGGGSPRLIAQEEAQKLVDMDEA